MNCGYISFREKLYVKLHYNNYSGMIDEEIGGQPLTSVFC